MELIDTTFLIDLLKGEKETKNIAQRENLLTTDINMFEIIKGICFKRPSTPKFYEIIDILGDIRVLPLDQKGVILAADIHAELRKKGEEISDNDCLIAGIALSNGINTIITKNKDHFSRIKGIKVETY